MRIHLLSFVFFLSLGVSYGVFATESDSPPPYEDSVSTKDSPPSYEDSNPTDGYDLASPLSEDELDEKIQKGKKKEKKKSIWKRIGSKIRKLSKGKQEVRNVKLAIAYGMIKEHKYNPKKLCKLVNQDYDSQKGPQGITGLLLEACVAEQGVLKGYKAAKSLATSQKILFLCKRFCNPVEYKKPGVYAQCAYLKTMGICKTLKMRPCVEKCDMPQKLSDVNDFLREASNEDMRYQKIIKKTSSDSQDQ